jgi:capsular polysaccharide biosynthesis protein
MPRLFVFRLLESFFRHRFLYALPVLLMVGCSIAYFLLVGGKYQAQGVVYIQRDSFLSKLTAINMDSGSIWTTPARETSDEINEMIQTDAFVRAVILQTPLEANVSADPASLDKVIEQVRKNAWAAPIGNNQISINAIWEEPDTAVQIASGIIANFLQWKENAQRTESLSALVFFNNIIEEYQASLDQARAAKKAYLVRHPEPLKGNRSETEVMEIEMLQQEIDMALARLTSAQNKEEDARLAMSQVDSNARHTYTIVDTPRIPQKGITSRREKALQASIFVVVGALLSGTALVVNILLDRSFYLPADVQQKLGLPVLAILPDPGKNKRRRTAKAEDKTQHLESISKTAPQKTGKQGMAPAGKLD